MSYTRQDSASINFLTSLASVLLVAVALSFPSYLQSQVLAPAPPLAPAHSAASPDRPAFEVASLKPSPSDHGFTSMSPFGTNTYKMTHASLAYLIEVAYEMQPTQLAGSPDWINTTYFDVLAKAEPEVQLNYESLKPRLQLLLEERFKLKTHSETRILPGYAMVISKDGPKLQATTGGAPYGINNPGKIRLRNSPIDSLADLLFTPIGRPVVNKTGLTGSYDIKLDYTSDGASDTTLPSVFTAVQEQLGLKLEPQKVPVELLIIDHIDRTPSEN